MSAAVAAAAIAEQAPETTAPVAKPAPVKAPEPEAKEKPKAKPEPAATPAEARQSTIEKFAKRMNAEAEKDGVQVDAPENERRAKPGPKPGSKREPKPETTAEATPAKVEPKPAAAATEAAATDAPEAETESDEDADTGKPETRATHQLKAKARLRHGDVDKALKLAFGDMRPEEFEASKEALAKKLGVSSKQWADYRKYQNDRERAAKQLEHNATELSRRLQADFQPMIEAKKAYKAGNYPDAFKLAFDEDINAFQRKAIHQHLSADPEKTRLAQELAAIKSEMAELRQGRAQPEQVDPQQQQLVALNREAQRTFEALSQSDDGEIAHFATKKAFIRRVVELRGEHYDPHTKTTIPLHVAADMARDERKRELEEWRYDSTASGAAAPSSELPGLAGNEPVRTSATRARSPLPSQAAQAGGSTRSMSRQERIAAFATRMG